MLGSNNGFSMNAPHAGRANGGGQTAGCKVTVATPAPKVIHLPNGGFVEVGSDGLSEPRLLNESKARAVARIFTGGWLDASTIVELLEDLENPERLLFGVCRKGLIRFCDHLEFEGSTLLPPSRLTEPFRSMNFPSGVSEYGSADQLAEECASFLREVVHLSEPDERVVAASVLHASIWDRVPFAVCPVLYGPPDVTDSLLNALTLICRRSVVVASASVNGLLRACSDIGATLLFLSGSLSKSVLKTLDTSSQENFLHLHRGTPVSCFGPKLIASRESREELDYLRGSFSIPLTTSAGARWRNLFDQEFMGKAEQLRRKLLQFRFDHIARMPMPTDEADSPFPKWGLIAGSLAAPFAAHGRWRKEIFQYFREKDFDPIERLPVRQSGVVSAGFYACHNTEILREGEISLKEFADEVNRVFHAFGEDFRISSRKAGAVLDGLGFPRRLRGSHGYRLFIDSESRELFHRLASLYGLLDSDPYSPLWSRTDCQLCKKYGFVST